MAYTLNTSHPLYADLDELIGVQGGALVSHKTARTFTLDSSPAPSFGSGTWGEHFVLAKADSATSKGASISPAISQNTYSNPTYSVFVALNTKGTITYDAVLLKGGVVAPFFSGSVAKAGVSITPRITGGTTLNSSAHSFCTTVTIGTGCNLYLDGVSEGTPYTSDPDTQRTDAGIEGIGINTNTGAADGLSVVWVAWFKRVLTEAEVLSLHNSLGASNTFGLVSSGSNSSLLLDAGVYSITGVSLTLDGAVTYTLPLDTGAYNVSSVAATFGVSFPLDAGIYNLNGNAVTLTQSTISSSTYSLLLGDGVYTITGMDVLTPVSTKLLIESGVYTVLGRNVLLQSSTEPIIVSSGGHTISVSIKIGI